MIRREFLAQFALAAGAAGGWSARRAGAASPETGSKTTVDPRRIFPNLALHNVDHLEPAPSGEGFRLNRIPLDLWTKLNPPARARAYSATGAELRFNLVGGEARVVTRFFEDRSAKARGWPVLIEHRQGDFLIRCVALREEWTELVIKRVSHPERLAAASSRQQRGFDPMLVRLALPYMPVTELLRIEGDITPPRPEQLPARRFLAYGSSITHGAYALRAGETYPARMAHALGFDHFNLGFSAGAHLEPAMAEWIGRRRDWDFAVLELGVNLVTPLTTAQFEARARVFMDHIAATHGERWVFVTDIFTAGPEFEANPRRAQFRATVAEIVSALGKPRIRHVDGRKLLTRTTGLSLDLLHPSADGFAEIAERFGAEIEAALGAAPP